MRGRKVYAQVYNVNINNWTPNCRCGLFSKNNPIIPSICISEWFAVPVNPDKWNSTV